MQPNCKRINNFYRNINKTSYFTVHDQHFRSALDLAVKAFGHMLFAIVSYLPPVPMLKAL